MKRKKQSRFGFTISFDWLIDWIEFKAVSAIFENANAFIFKAYASYKVFSLNWNMLLNETVSLKSIKYVFVFSHSSIRVQDKKNNQIQDKVNPLPWK